VVAALAIYVTLGIRAMLGTLHVANRALDVFERARRLSRLGCFGISPGLGSDGQREALKGENDAEA
jgi:hypothetical protein